MAGRYHMAAVLAALLLGGCADMQPPPAVQPPDAQHRLTVYVSHKPQVYEPLFEEFQERTGIWIDATEGGTNELLERIAAESAAPRCDVMFGGGVESLLAYADCFAPLCCTGSDALLPGLAAPQDIYTPFSSLPVVLIYNTKLVGAQELTGWQSLFEERWRGQIALADPTVSGSSYTAVLTMLSCFDDDDRQRLALFAAQLDGRLLADSGDVVQAVAEGVFEAGITLEETALKQMALNAAIGIVYPQEGTSAVPDGSAMVRGAPHPEAARRFMDFVFSREVQQRVADDFYRRPVRADVQLPEDRRPTAQLALIDYDLDWASGVKAEFVQRWDALMKEARG